MDKEQGNAKEKEWAQIIEDSRRNNNNMMNMFSMEPTHVETFTERFRNQAAESTAELERMQGEMKQAIEEVDRAKKTAFESFPVTALPFSPAAGKRTLKKAVGQGKAQYYIVAGGEARQVPLAWHYLHSRESNSNYIRKDFGDLFINTEKLLEGVVGLTHVVDQMAAEGLHPNQLLLYEEEFKNQSRKINDVYHQINLAAFHLHGTLAKEKEIAINICLQKEKPQDILRHHQAVLWAYNQYLQYRTTGNQYLISAMQALELFMTAIRKEVMRRKVEMLHANARTISLERMEAIQKQKAAAAARRELGEDFEEEEIDLPQMPGVPVTSTIDIDNIPIPEEKPEEPEVEPEEEEIAPAEESEYSEFGDEEEGKKSIFPLIILALILIGVGVYYFTKG